jgi:hypothetical protein
VWHIRGHQRLIIILVAHPEAYVRIIDHCLRWHRRVYFPRTSSQHFTTSRQQTSQNHSHSISNASLSLPLGLNINNFSSSLLDTIPASGVLRINWAVPLLFLSSLSCYLSSLSSDAFVVLLSSVPASCVCISLALARVYFISVNQIIVFPPAKERSRDGSEK